MPLQKLQFQPGIMREATEYARSGGWFDADKVRFRMGYPEKIGGWQALVRQRILGVCRYIHQWSDLESDHYIGLGTNSHLYILWAQTYYDITPVRDVRPTITAADPFQTGGVGTTEVIVTMPAHDANVGDYVIFSGATTNVDVYTPDMLNQQFRITAIDSPDVFRIEMPVENQADGVTGGGPAVTATFLIPSGQEDAILGQGWGIPPWGGAIVSGGVATPVSGWGEAFSGSQLNPGFPSAVQLRLWDLDNFGQDLVANIRNGPVYYWHHDTGHEARAVPLSQQITVGGVIFTPNQVPTIAAQVLVSPNDRHLIAAGCDNGLGGPQDPLLVRWSTEEDAYQWEPLRTNSAGGQRLSAGSFIIAAMRTRSEILIWTDLGLWSMRYIGTPYIFGFDSVAEGLSVIAPNAMINAGNVVYWMDRGVFYAYTGGQMQELPCAVKDYIFNNFNYLQAYKVYAGHNHEFSEVIWFYPSADSIENNRYVIYNYVDQLWTIGNLERTAWLDMGRIDYPIATDRLNSLLYRHEIGSDDDQSPMGAYIESADLDIDGGEHYLFVRRLIPDVYFRGTAETPTVGITVLGRSAPGRPKTPLARITVAPWSPEQYIRVRERQLSVRVESDGLGVSWRLGTLRADMQPDGRR
jgi:hypothetical protein